VLYQGDNLIISLKQPGSFETVPAVMEEIKSCLANLKEMAGVIDFRDKAQYANYTQNLVILKSFYSRAERLALNEKRIQQHTNGRVD